MVEQAPLWTAAVAPALLVAFALLVALCADRLISARAAGSPAGTRTVLAGLGSEAARLMVGQRRTTLAADRLMWRLGLVGLPAVAVLAVAVIPFGRWTLSDLSVGVVWFNAMEIAAWTSAWAAGWGPNSVWSLIGGYRFIAQGLAYELPNMFALIGTATAAASLRVGDVVAAQRHL